MQTNISSKLFNNRIDISQYIIYIVFAIIFLFFSVTLFNRGFLSVGNLMNIARQVAMISIMAVGMTFVLSAAEIDLSFGSIVALSAVTAALALRWSESVFVSICAGVFIGILAGILNGALVGYVGIPSFLVTLGTSSIILGIARWMTQLRSIPVDNGVFVYIFGSGNILGIPVLFIWMVCITISGVFLLHRTVFGRQVLATGGNLTAAKYSGINIKKIKMNVLVLNAVLASLAGILYVGRLQGARYTLGENDLLIVIAAVIIGGTSLFGGKGRIFGSVIGAFIMGMINNGLILMDLSVDHQLILRGSIIIASVIFMMKSERKA